jgi:hypothetical protein
MGLPFDLEALLSSIKAYHVRVGENAHMVNVGDWLVPNTEEKFQYGTTGFLHDDQAKDFLEKMLSEAYW